MKDKFDYSLAMTELEGIAKKVENPETRLEDIDKLIARSRELIKDCREYLRAEMGKIDDLDKI